MSDISSYVQAFGNTGFSTRPLNALDALVFSQLVHLPLEAAGAGQEPVKIRRLPELLADIEPQMPAEFMLRHQLKLLRAAAPTRRFGPLMLSHFVDEVEPENNKQFSAMRVHLPRGETLLAFRGTDLSLAGWEEDFHISFDSPVPAQRRAASYLREAAEETTGRLTLCGHSKGGNLAVYAAAFCGDGIRPRIHRVYSFDAPGQAEGVLAMAEYRDIRRRIRAFLPERSLVGVLLSQTRPFTVVACDAFGLLQHNPFNWQIQGGAFVKRRSLSAQSRFLDKTLNSWIQAMTRQEREQMTRAVFDILQAPGEEGFDGLSENFFKNLLTMWKAAALLPKELRKAARRSTALLLDGAFDTLREDVKDLASGVAQTVQSRFRSLLSLAGQDEEKNDRKEPKKPEKPSESPE